MLLDTTEKKMSFRKQCELLDISRSGLYYEPKGESEYNLKLMNMIDKEYTDHPNMGVPSMTSYLRNMGKKCGPKRVRRLMKLMGLEAIYPKPRTSIPNKQHKIYPYLLKDVELMRPNQVWSTDITYIRLKHGFAYLVAIMDWYSRKVLSWRLSNTMDVGFCCEALEEALLFYGTPDVFNSDQGSQFTSGGFIDLLKGKGITISMTGKGRALDNVFVERLWWTVKYNDVYIKGYETVPEARAGLKKFFEYYNERRGHSSLEGKSPDMVYYGKTYQQINSYPQRKKEAKKEMTTTAISYF
jgi:putative transposase